MIATRIPSRQNRPASRPASLRLLPWALTAVAALSAPMTSSGQQMSLSSEKLNELDASRAVAKHIDCDRLSKCMLLSYPQTDESDFGVRTMVEAISQMADSPETMGIICADLKMGDEQLARALQNALVALNVPSTSAFAMVEKWATYGPDEGLKSLLSNISSTPDVASSLAAYFMTVDPDWVKLVRGLAALVNGESEGGRAALATAVANATGQSAKSVEKSIEKARSGDFAQRWNLSADAKKILTSRGALAREILEQQSSAGSFYDKGWSALCDKVATYDPAAQSYVKQSAKLKPLYGAYSDCLQAALKDGGKENLIVGMIKGSSIPASRFRWMVEELSGQTYETFGKDMGVERTSKKIKGTMAENLSTAVERDPIWAGILLWHLTRPAEAAARTTRTALPDALSSDPEFAREYVKRGFPLGQTVDQAVQARGGYSHYSGGKAETLEKVESGEVTKEALVLLSSKIAEVLATDDRAWDSVVMGGASTDWTKRLVTLGLERVPACAASWSQTMVKNDLALGGGFAKWLTEAKALPTEQLNANSWIASIANSSVSSQAFGNADMAKFKKLFAEFIGTQTGWNLVRTRLEMEGVAFPTAIRDMLTSASITSPDVFWKMFRILAASKGDTMIRLRPFLETYIAGSNLPKMVLDETAAENAFAADASSTMWKATLTPTSPAMDALVKEMIEVKVKTEPHALGNLCLVEELNSPSGWDIAQPLATAMLEKIRSKGAELRGAGEREQLIYALTNHADMCGWTYELLLNNPEFRNNWAARVISKVLFMGKAPAAAWLVKQNGGLLEQWRAEMGRQIAKDPYLLRAFVDSLVTRRIGDREWLMQVNAIRKEIAAAVFYDRILVEQMLGYPETEYREALSGEISRIFGEYVTDRWKDVSAE